jgi:hypothetical protein
MNKRVIIPIAFIAIIIAGAWLGVRLYERFTQDTWPPENVVQDPQSGTWIIKNELVILSSEKEVRQIAEKYGGRITYSVPETASYQVYFPVNNLSELDAIKKSLQDRGTQAVYSIVIEPPDCMEGPC